MPGVEPRLAGLPLSTDLALHASPLLTLLIDFFAFEHKFSKEHVRKAAPLAVVGFSIWYASFVEYCATFSGFCKSSCPCRLCTQAFLAL